MLDLLQVFDAVLLPPSGDPFHDAPFKKVESVGVDVNNWLDSFVAVVSSRNLRVKCAHGFPLVGVCV
jgi:hypothetical protein